MAEDWSAVVDDIIEALEEEGYDAILYKKPVKVGPSYAPTNLPPETLVVRVVSRKLSSATYTAPPGIRFTKALFIAAVAGKKPVENDRMKDQGKEYGVVYVDTIAPGGVEIAYRVFLGA